MQAGGATRPRVLVTRPDTPAADWVEGLHSLGWPAAALPLLAIEPPVDDSSLQAACLSLWPSAAGTAPAAVMFVSPTAVQFFFAAAGSGKQADWPPLTRAVATGPGTARALRAAGVPEQSIVQPAADAPSFDSEHVWPLLRDVDWRGQAVWIVRGEIGRDWLAERWRDAGAVVNLATAYRRVEPVWTSQQQALLRDIAERPSGYVWLLSSSESARYLARKSSHALAAPAVATHPAIAETARALGFCTVRVAAPTLDGVVRCLESLFH